MAYLSSLEPDIDNAYFDEAGDELFELFLQFRLEDIQELRATDKGKARATIHYRDSDAEIARKLYEEELEATLRSVKDYRLARSLDIALATDYACLAQFAQLEAQERRDHDMAWSLSGERRPDNQADTDNSGSIPRFTTNGSDQSEPGPSNSGSISALMEPQLPIVHRKECVICQDDIRGPYVQVPCGHFYDTGCLRDLFQAVVGDESLYPARCCKQTIPLDIVRPHIKRSLIQQYEEKSEEFDTKDRLYCSNKTCSLFLGPRTSNWMIIYCPSCGYDTCTACSAEAHPFRECGDDKDIALVLELARESGWQRCPGCHQMVELNHGCYHMTCRCRAQFCYLCAAPWKTCSCVQWDENRLVAAAEERVGNQFANARRPHDFAERVTEAAEALRVNHDCEHRDWAYRPGGGICPVCSHHPREFLLRCRGCSMLACVRCRRNRL